MSGVKRKNKTKLKKAGKKGSMSELNKTYSEEMLKLAIKAIQNNEASYGEAEQIYGIPRRAILQRLKKNETFQTEEEEENTDGEIRSQNNQSEDELRFECVPCKAWFQYNSQLRYHIRRHHFNRVSRIPYAENQEVDQVWYEKVVNSEALVKISKVSENELIIQKINDATDLPAAIISKDQEEVLDVRDVYPINSKKNKTVFECHVCNKSFGKRLLGKHFAKAHPQLVRKKCPACQTKFKRAYNCATHICPAENIHNVPRSAPSIQRLGKS